MTATLTYHRTSMLRELLSSMAYHRRRIFLVGLFGVLLTVGVALIVQPGYQARSSLLVLLGQEYTYRGVAGQQTPSNGALTQTQILHTEADILGSDELRRQVIGQIGIAKLYPKLLQPASGFRHFVTEAKTYLEQLFRPASGGAGNPKLDPMTAASRQFASNFTITVDRDASVITLGFTNPNAEVTAAALKQLEADYQERRRELYNDVQVPVLRTQVNHLQRQLTAASDQLAAFKRSHNISDFKARRLILLQQQGTLETALRTAESGIAEQTARIGALDQQLRVATNSKSADPAAALEGMVQAYRSRASRFTSHYFGSAAVDRAGSEALRSQAEIAQLRSKGAFTLVDDKRKAEATLSADRSAQASATAQLGTVTAALRGIDADELKLNDLERAQAVADESYRAAAKILHERSLVEQLDAGKPPGVRVIQPPLVPEQPRPLRRLILGAGLLLTALLMVAVALLSHFFRTTYFAADALEFDTDLAVLATVPDSRELPRLGLLVGPR